MKPTFPFPGTRWIPAVTLLLIILSFPGAGRGQSLGEQARELRKSNPRPPVHEITEDDLSRQDEMLTHESCPLPEKVIETTACEVARRPDRFDGKLVAIRGLVHMKGNSMDLREEGCGAVLVVHSEDIGIRDRQGYRTCHGPRFRQLYQLVTTPHSVDRVQERYCSPRCTVYAEVTATFVGRIQANLREGSVSGYNERSGFGFANEYPARVVLFAVKEFKPVR